jgi:hypothetical protein
MFQPTKTSEFEEDIELEVLRVVEEYHLANVVGYLTNLCGSAHPGRVDGPIRPFEEAYRHLKAAHEALRMAGPHHFHPLHTS